MDDYGNLIHWSFKPQRFSSLGTYGWRAGLDFIYDRMDDAYAWDELDR